MSSKLFGVMVIAFAMIAVMALVGTCPTTVVADGNAKPATDDKKPLAEAPLSPKNDYPVSVGSVDNDGEPCVTIFVIDDGAPKLMAVLGEWKQTISFQLRTDGGNYTSAQFFGKPDKRIYGMDAFTSAVIFVPDEECLKAWTDWYPKACQEAWDRKHPKPLEPARIFPDGPHKPK
ncbi:MAG: hypothetical protein HYW56_01855 [Candidatus Harrisonbacteria bacterium]|nr:hypothetical protein [Candidatus Harrisonbacteria bacterium]MBI2604264.1 hypothetical protein [Candidatus Harrisonbacteria bacterium]